MKIKSEKQQLREKREYLERLISWQELAVRRARKRYDNKSKAIIPIWIGSNTDTLWFYYEREKGIRDSLQDYLELIDEKIRNCS